MASDADIESSFSEDTDSGYLYLRERGIQILVFQCDKKDFIVTGEVVKHRVSTSAERVQRDVILSYRNPNCCTINSDQFPLIFGSNHSDFLSSIHSILILLPCEKNNQVTFFISKQFVNTPVHASQNISLLQSPAPFFCRSVPKPATRDYISYIKEELNTDNSEFHFYHDNTNIEVNIEYFNRVARQAFYLHVVKLKTDIVKFVYHKSCVTSHSLHIECLSTDTIIQVLKFFLKQISKDLDDFKDRDVEDLSVTNENGDRVDSNLHAIICLLSHRKSEGEHLGHSYPTFYVHLTPKQHAYFPIKVRVLGEDRGHTYPFTVFIRNDFSYSDLVNEISKHCHWKPKSFEVCSPNSTKSLEPVASLDQLSFKLTSRSVLSARKIQKMKLTIESDLLDMKSLSVEEYPKCTVELLKDKVSKRCNILPKQFDLMYKNTVLDEQVLLESIIEKNAVLGLNFNENRIILRLYIHKGLRSQYDKNLDIGFEKLVHIKVDDPESDIGDISRSFAVKLGVNESNLHITHQGYYMEKTMSYQDAHVTDGNILCLHHTATGSHDDETVFQLDPSGFFEQVSENSITAMSLKLRKLQLKEKTKEPKISVITKKQRNQKIFERMISVPSKSSRNSLTVDQRDCGYKSDTDLLHYNRETIIPKSSPSDSQLNTPVTSKVKEGNTIMPVPTKLDVHIPTSSSSPSFMLTPPITPQVSMSLTTGTSGYPGAKGFQFTAWSNEGNMPNIAEIFGSPAVSHISSYAHLFTNEDPYNKLFLTISKEIVKEWKNVGRYLNLGENNISIIDGNNWQVEEKSYSMLLKWREVQGTSATKEVLIRALENCELKRVAEIVEDYVMHPVTADQNESPERTFSVQDDNYSDVDVDGMEEEDNYHISDMW